MRLDTTVVETNIHYPTDSSLLGDGARVLIRAMKRIGEIAGKQGAKLRGNSGFIVARQPRSRAACDNFGDARP
jgi:IS5 family transposase